MKSRLLRRRFSLTSASMAVRSAMPWPLRWAIAAIVLGFSGAIALWAFEFGSKIAGVNQHSQEELVKSNVQIVELQTALNLKSVELSEVQKIANTGQTLLTSSKAMQDQLLQRNKELAVQNDLLRDDLAFFEKLIPLNGSANVAIRGLQAERVDERTVKWQVLVIQARKNPVTFNGALEVSLSGFLNKKPWTAILPNGIQSFSIGQYGRREGLLIVPNNVELKRLTIKVFEGKTLLSTQSIKI